MPRSIDERTLATVAAQWLRSEWLNSQIDQHREGAPRFQPDEAKDFARYLWGALHGAPTHALPKMPYNLILDLGIRNDGLNPGAKVRRLQHSYGPQLVKMDCNRRFGPSVLFGIVDDAVTRVPQLGRIDYVLHNCSHFGFARLYAERLADAGLISEIRNTAGRGDEVFPLGADTTDPSCARMGTNPVTLTLPFGAPGEPHFSADMATTPVSFGTMAFRRHTGERLPPGSAVDAAGAVTDDPEKAVKLLHTDRLGYGLGLYMEGLGAVIGGGPPQQRCRRSGDRPGGSSDCLVSVMSLEYLACVGGCPIERLHAVLDGIVSGNGHSRLPGTGRPRATSETIELDGTVLESFLRMADEAKVRI